MGLDAPAAAGLLNAAATGALVGVVGWQLRRHFGSTPLALWGALTVMLATPIATVGTWAVSEPVFILLLMLSLAWTARFLDDGQRHTLVAAAVCTALACLTRYSGAAIVLTVAVLLLCRRDSWPDRARNVALYSVIAALPVAVWMVRNYLVSESFAGHRAAPERTLAENLTDVLHLWRHGCCPPAGGWTAIRSWRRRWVC